MNPWYLADGLQAIDTPCLVIYKERVTANIERAIQMAGGNARRLRPHVKTHKSIQVSQMMLEAGINKFKCATIAEAEMLGMAGALDVLLAYQPCGPKQLRFIQLIQQYPFTRFSCLCDDEGIAAQLSQLAIDHDLLIDVFVDADAGMHRTGIATGEAALQLYRTCATMKGLRLRGLHVYDGHLRQPNLAERKAASNAAFEKVHNMVATLLTEGFDKPTLIAGGSPTFPVHLQRAGVECSPGTFIFWDNTYLTACPEQPFEPAALVLSRVISTPAPGLATTDLGHKAIASENSLDKRVLFLNQPNLTFTGHSEEHLVCRVPPGTHLQVGDMLFGLPWHICPTVALYNEVAVVENGQVSGWWPVTARGRKLTV